MTILFSSGPVATDYDPTLKNIQLTPAQEMLMVEAIKHIEDAPTAMKKTTRWQFWFRKIWDTAQLENGNG